MAEDSHARMDACSVSPARAPNLVADDNVDAAKPGLI
jgi:hypothetical protein